MTTILIISGAYLLIAILKFFISKPKQEIDSSVTTEIRQSINKKTTPSDKLIIITNIDIDDLRSIITLYAWNYEDENIIDNLLVVKISENEFTITFAHDINFEAYCYFINYLKYPEEVKCKPTILAWTKTNSTDEFVPERALNKLVMLYIPEEDDEYDNVFLTTEDNIGYKIFFEYGKKPQLLQNPNKTFSSPPLNIIDLNQRPAEIIQ